MNCNVDFLFLFFQDFVCKTLSNEAVWQQKAEDALKRATEDSDSGEYKLRGIKYRLRQIFVQYYREVLESFLNISNLQKRPKTFITTTEQLICFCFNFGRDVYQRGRYVSPVKRSEGRVSEAEGKVRIPSSVDSFLLFKGLSSHEDISVLDQFCTEAIT